MLNDNDKKSLYINPQQIAKNPIKAIKYLAERRPSRAVPFKDFEKKHRYNPNKNNTEPCAISPYITPNKNGNVIIVKMPGLISLYLGIP